MGDRDDLKRMDERLWKARQERRQRPPSKQETYGTNETVGRRFLEPDYPVGGFRRPLYLPGFEELAEAGFSLPKAHPGTCSGPRAEKYHGKGRFMCRQRLLCGVCWDQHRHAQALKVLERQLHGGPVWKFSVSLPVLRHDPKLVKAARDRFSRAVASLGYTVQDIYVHTFGQNPAEGPKGHLDGFLGALPGEEPEPLAARHLDESTATLAPDIADKVGAWTGAAVRYEPIFSIREVNTLGRNGVRDMLSGAKYAGRETFPTLALIAGQLDTHGREYRLTDVNGRTCRPGRRGSIQSITTPKYPLGNYNRDEVQTWMKTAAEWNQAIPLGKHTSKTRPHPRLRPELDALTWWQYWRLRPPSWRD